MTHEEQQFRRMTQTPVDKLILSLGIPTVISTLATNIYNLVDTYFVGTIGTSASGATGVVFGLMAILQAFGFMLGHGSGTNISARLGARKTMRDTLGMTADEMHTVFAKWNETELDSYLIEITRDILACKDTDGAPIVDKILDAAGQKGTGKWTGIAALDEGVPLTLISEAVFARCLSAMLSS